MKPDYPTIRRLFDTRDFQRGERYLKDGKVTACKMVNPEMIDGVVSGTHRFPYQQRVHLRWDNRGHLIGIDGDCTCPVGHNCKHVAAVMLHAAENIDFTPPTLVEQVRRAQPKLRSENPDTRSLAAWLKQLDQIDIAAGADRDEEEFPPNVRDRLFYVVHPGARDQLKVTLIKGSMLKDGSISQKHTRYNPQFLNSGHPPRFIPPNDARICELLDRSGMISNTYYRRSEADKEDLVSVFKKMLKTGRARWRSLEGVPLHLGEPRQSRFEWQQVTPSTQKLAIMGEDSAPQTFLVLDGPWYVNTSTGECGKLELDLPPPVIDCLLEAPEVPLEAARDVADAMNKLPGITLPKPDVLHLEERKADRPVPVLQLQGLKAHTSGYGYRSYGRTTVSIPIARIGFEYEGHHADISSREPIHFRDGHNAVRLLRDEHAEDRMISLLDDCGLTGLDLPEDFKATNTIVGDLAFATNRSPLGIVHDYDDEQYSGQRACLAFLANKVPELKALGWDIRIDKSWPFKLADGVPRIRSGVEDANGAADSSSAENDWFSFALKVDVGDNSLDILPVVEAIITTLPAEMLEEEGIDADTLDLEPILEDLTLFPRAEDGTYIKIDAAGLEPVVRALLSVYGLDGSFHRGEAGKISELADALEGCGIPFNGGEALRELGRKLKKLASLDQLEPPTFLKGDLRPYQKSGYGWMRALSETGFGGVLADDMGLGKTIQTLALLSARHLEDKVDRPSLLIVPTSLVGNWQREAAQFVPDLKILVLHGADRKTHFSKIEDHHVVLTTYPLVNRDHEVLMARDYDLAILDEAQAVKNPAAAISKRIRDIKSRQRLALTGTPLENNLEELWSLYDWLVPGLLGNRQSFKKVFRTPIEKEQDQSAHRLLVSRIKPFLLRRTKEEVATDLPEKTEITEIVPLSTGQTALYETIRSAMDQRVSEAIRAKGLNASRITVLDALLKLRQVCCDPGLVKLDAARKITESAKRARLLDMLAELIAEGRRVLVFSQFVEMLNLIEDDVRGRGWKYLKLTGQTRKRAEMVAEFQSNDDIPLFLISTKAGGVGLNLTAADTVILYDPWWNPAVERQAMDRAHRIGQDKTVFVYKLVAEGTVEAAIQELQEKKQALADNLFEGSDSGPMALSETDLTALFQPIE